MTTEKDTQRRALVTGASGIIGQNLVKRLLNDGWEVVTVDRGGAKEIPAHPALKKVAAGVLDMEKLEAAMVGVTHVFHLAAIATDWAKDRRDFYRTNVGGTRNVFEAARKAGVKRVIHTSSAGVIGPPDRDKIEPVTEDNIRTVDFFNDYEVSKSIADRMALEYVLAGMDIVRVMPTRVFGPGRITRNNGYVLLIKRFIEGKLTVFPGPSYTIANLVHIDDVVEGHILAMEKGRSGEKYLLAGANASFGDLFKTLRRLTGKRNKAVSLPVPLLYMIASVEAPLGRWFGRAPMVTHNYLGKLAGHCPVSYEKAQRELGYQPADFETTLRKTLSWLAEIKKK